MAVRGRLPIPLVLRCQHPMGCGTSTVMTSAHAPQRKMSFDQLMATEVNLQDFIDWFRKDTSHDTKPGRALLRIICGEGVRTQSLGDLISIMAAKALEEKFDEEMGAWWMTLDTGAI